jgi:hypothetical protein
MMFCLGGLPCPCNRIGGPAETYFFSLFPRKTFRHPYAMMAPTPTRYHTGRRPRTGMLRCGRRLESIYGFLKVGGVRSVGDTDLVLHGFVPASRGEVLRHLVRWDVACGGDGGEGETSQMATGSQLGGAGAKKCRTLVDT